MSPLTLGGDCFHYHINDDDSPSAANPSTARRGQAEVRARQLLKQNTAASGGKHVALVAAVQQCHKRVMGSTGREFAVGVPKKKKANMGVAYASLMSPGVQLEAAGQTFCISP